MRVHVGTAEHEVADGAGVAALLREAGEAVEVWVLRGETVLGALLAGARGWLHGMYWTDRGFVTSHDPAYAGPPDAAVEFPRANGQLDAYPAAQTVPRAVAEAALAHYADTGLLATTVTWIVEGDWPDP